MSENEQELKELKRIEDFVKAGPEYVYNLDQHKDQICRQLSNNQEECIHLKLNYTQMFEQMQKLGFFCALPMDPLKTHMECRRA